MKALREPLAKARAWAGRLGTSPPAAVEKTDFTRIGTFWAGATLPPTHRLCLKSWLELGYNVDVFSYHTVDGVPLGCTLRDAGEILPRATFLDPETRPPLIADIFRLTLLTHGEHVWCDTDLMLFRRLPAAQYILAAREHFGPVCNACLWLSPSLGLIDEILSDFHARRVSAWSHGRVYSAWFKTRLSGRPWDHRGYPMHHWGRHALDHGVVKYRIERELLPHPTFYALDGYDDRLTVAGPFEHLTEDPTVTGLHFFWKDEDRIAAAERGSFFHWAKQRFGDTS